MPCADVFQGSFTIQNAVDVATIAPYCEVTGDLAIDLAARVVRRAGGEVDLSPKEFEILAVLAEKIGKVVRHAELLKAVWGSDRADIQYLRVYVSQLRAKLEPDPTDPRYLLSDPGVGYRLALLDA